MEKDPELLKLMKSMRLLVKVCKELEYEHKDWQPDAEDGHRICEHIYCTARDMRKAIRKIQRAAWNLNQRLVKPFFDEKDFKKEDELH